MDLRTIKNRIKGPVFPVITAFTKEGELDIPNTLKYVGYLCDSGASVIYVMAHSSRLGLLSLKEVKLLNEETASFCKKYYPSVICICATPMYGGVEAAKGIAKASYNKGAHVISVIFTERYYTDEQVVNFFKDIADSVSCGILIHEEQLNTIHGTQRQNWPLTLLDKVVALDNVIAIKEDAKEDGFTEEIIKRYKDSVAIIVSGGSKDQFLKFGPMGCQAYLVGLGSIRPDIALNFYDDYKIGMLYACENIVNSLEKPFFKVTKTIGWHVGIKTAMTIMRLMDIYERSPLPTATKEQYNEVKKMLLRTGLM